MKKDDTNMGTVQRVGGRLVHMIDRMVLAGVRKEEKKPPLKKPAMAAKRPPRTASRKGPKPQEDTPDTDMVAPESPTEVAEPGVELPELPVGETALPVTESVPAGFTMPHASRVNAGMPPAGNASVKEVNVSELPHETAPDGALPMVKQLDAVPFHPEKNRDEERPAGKKEGKEDSLADIFKEVEQKEASPIDLLINSLPDTVLQELLVEVKEVERLLREHVSSQPRK